MFTGIVEAVGKIIFVNSDGDAMRVYIDPGEMELVDVSIGDSIAVNGACLTVTVIEEKSFAVDVSGETLNCTYGLNISGNAVNLEKALRLSDRLDGHLVSGHVDGVGEVSQFRQSGDRCLLMIRPPVPLLKYIAPKGSITVDGVSLTVNRAEDHDFEVNLIPHTLINTNFKYLEQGDKVNIEIDIVARYVARLLSQE
jgi:riboflavin synthase